MKKNSKFLRIIAVVMLSLLIAIPLVSCGKGETVAADASGASHGIAWDFKQHNQTLTIRKTGEGNPDFTDASSVAWSSIASSVKAVYIEDGVEGVGDYWFYGMDKLASVRLPESTTYIGKSAFAFCSSLGQIGDGKLPQNVVSIRERAFEASGLTNIDLPAALNAVGDYAFVYCNKLANVAVRSAAVNSFNDTVFSYCSALGEINMAAIAKDYNNVSIPVKNGILYVTPARFFVTTLDHTTWEYKVTKKDDKQIGTLRVSGSGSMEKLENYMGEGTKLAEIFNEMKAEGVSVTVIISSGIKTVDDYAFAGIKNIKEVVLERVADNRENTTIGEGAFNGCTGLTSFRVDRDIIEIKANAFEGSGLESLDIPNSSVKIGEKAFANCTSLKTVVVRADNEDVLADNCFEGSEAIEKYYVVDQTLFEGLKAKYGDKVEKVDSKFEDFTVYHELAAKDEATENGGEAAPAPAPEAPKNDGKKGSKIALIIMGVLIVGIIVAFILFKRYDKKTSGNNTTVVKNKNGQGAKNAKNSKNTKKGKK